MDIHATYQQIEQSFLDCVERDRVITDDHLARNKPDARRSLTLLLRPTIEIAQSVEKTVAELTHSAGQQYTQPGAELHTTVLSVIPGTERYGEIAHRVPDCERAVEDALAMVQEPIAVEYRGLIGSNDSILVKGYPQSEALQQLRQRIIQNLTELGIEQQLERRYTMVAAHMTAMRFTQQPNSLGNLRTKLESFAETLFGTTRVESLELVECDWYMRTGKLTLLRRFAV